MQLFVPLVVLLLAAVRPAVSSNTENKQPVSGNEELQLDINCESILYSQMDLTKVVQTQTHTDGSEIYLLGVLSLDQWPRLLG